MITEVAGELLLQFIYELMHNNRPFVDVRTSDALQLRLEERARWEKRTHR